MKKLLVMAAMVLSSVGAFAQYSAGDITIQPKVGLNISKFTNTTNLAKYKAGFVGGAEFEYHASDVVGISAGVLYSSQGVKVKENEIKLEQVNLNYINIPILANVYVAEGLAIKAGIQPAFYVSGSAKINGTSYDVDAPEVKAANEGLSLKPKSFDFAIPVGISYEYANVCLDARYNIGVTKITDGNNSGKNSVFQITLGYKFKL